MVVLAGVISKSVCLIKTSVLFQLALWSIHNVAASQLNMDLQTIVYISVGVLSGACALLAVAVLVLSAQVSSLKKGIKELQSGSRLRVQKLKMDASNGNHAFQSATLAPGEELTRRGYSMYVADDVESGRSTERQTGGQFVEELSRELEHRQSRQGQGRTQGDEPGQAPPPFLLQAIEESKRRSRSLANPAANGRGRASETNPNFIY